MPHAGSEELADIIRELSPSISVEVTEAFLERHPDWRGRYGARAMSAGVQDAGYHLAFLAGAIEGGDASAFASYARWAAGVLGARGIQSKFLRENLTQLREALDTRVPAERTPLIDAFFTAATNAISDDAAVVADATLSLTADVFLQAILSGQRHAAVQIAREALRNGLSLEDLYVDVFQPALYAVGSRWEANRLTVAQEHIATAITQFVMAQIYQPPESSDQSKGNVVLTGVEGEMHNIGALMVGDLLEASGWRLRFLGTNLPASSILAAVRETTPTHVGISATMLFNVGTVRTLIRSIRDEFGDRITLLVGGAAFRSVPDLWRQVAADASATDLRGVQRVFAGSR